MSAITRNPAATPEEAYLDRLLVARLLLPTSLPGIYARGAAFTELMKGLEKLLTQQSIAMGAQVLRCPPVLPRAVVEKCGGLPPSPQLSEVMMTPSAWCAIYPYLTGTLPLGGKITDAESWCYCNEPSLNPLQLCAFQVREFIQAGTRVQVESFQDTEVTRAQELLESLGLKTTLAHAGENKRELRIPIVCDNRPTAVVSVKNQSDRYGQLFDIRTTEGSAAHTACIAFGLERLVLALLAQHGLQPSKWPSALKMQLGLSA